MMKKFFQKLLAKFIKTAVKKSVNDIVSNSDETPDVPEVESITIPGDNTKKKIWKFIIQALITILTALLTTLGASCVSMH